MSEDVMIDAVGMFYATVYDRTMSWFERANHKFPNSIEGSEEKLDFARIIAHCTLCMVADQLKINEEEYEGVNDLPLVRYYVIRNGEEFRKVDDEISPVLGWLSDVVPGEGLLGMFSKSTLPSKSLLELDG